MLSEGAKAILNSINASLKKSIRKEWKRKREQIIKIENEEKKKQEITNFEKLLNKQFGIVNNPKHNPFK